jgi:hypothetical protein
MGQRLLQSSAFNGEFHGDSKNNIYEKEYKNNASEERATALFETLLKGSIIIAEGPGFRSFFLAFFEAFFGFLRSRKEARKLPKIT